MQQIFFFILFLLFIKSECLLESILEFIINFLIYLYHYF